MTTIATSTAATATAYSNQRKVDRCQNGVLWVAHVPTNEGGAGGSNIVADFHYSADEGATFTASSPALSESGGQQNSHSRNFSFFIDLDDYCHLVWKDNDDGRIYYRRGTPNAGRTAWTWSSALLISSSVGVDYPNVVAHREGTDWKAHLVYGKGDTVQNSGAMYAQVNVLSQGGVLSRGSYDVVLGNAYSNNSSSHFPSIDFNHTGDGKTVQGGTPHLYVAWSAGATGSGKGIRFKKATYSGGTWTWGTEREIDSTRYVPSEAYGAPCMFDGTRVVIAGTVAEAADAAQADLMLYERDAADTTTTTRTLKSNPGGADSYFTPSASYDANGNVHFIGGNLDGTSGNRDLRYVKWGRAAATLDTPVVIDATTSGSSVYVSAKRGYSNGKIEFIYTDGTSSPYNVTYGSLALSTPATVQVWNGSAWVDAPLTYWDGSDWVAPESSQVKVYDGSAWVEA